MVRLNFLSVPLSKVLPNHTMRLGMIKKNANIAYLKVGTLRNKIIISKVFFRFSMVLLFLRFHGKSSNKAKLIMHAQVVKEGNITRRNGKNDYFKCDLNF